MIAFFTKSDASEGFDQIVDFLNAQVIQYALMVNPIIYVSCIKQFWSSVSIKRSNEVARLQALIDRKKVVITEDSIRQALRLDDADGVDYLPNEDFFTKLARMGYEKPSTKLTFYNAFFLAQWKTYTPPPSPTQEHIPSPPQAQTIQPSSPQQQPSQTAEISMTLLHTLLNTCAILTKQVANLEQDKIAQAIEIKKLKHRKDASKREGKIAELDVDEDVTLEKVDAEVTMDADVQGRLLESQAKVYHLDLEHAEKVLTMQDTDEVVTTAATTITISQVPKASVPRRRRGVIIQDPKEATTALVIMQSDVKSKDKGKGILVEELKPLKRQAQIEHDKAIARQLEAELNANINWNDVVDQVKRKERQDNTVMKYQALKRKPITEAHARKNMMVYLKNMAGFKMDFFRRMTYTNIRSIFKKHYNLNQAFLERVEEEVTGPKEEKGKRNDDSLEQRAAKKQKINKETEELKTYL
nr:hypothetical protein [Tanacetum cinerariifolium]